MIYFLKHVSSGACIKCVTDTFGGGPEARKEMRRAIKRAVKTGLYVEWSPANDGPIPDTLMPWYCGVG